MKKINTLRIIVIALLLVLVSKNGNAQHTFSIVAVDEVTGEIGSAGATCLDIDDLAGEEGALVISDIIKGVGAIHSQAFWHPLNQAAARVRMESGDSPQEILDWLFANDPAPGNNQSRQYGIVDLIGGAGGTPRVAAFTGSGNGSVANHIVGPNYAIQGNILISQEVLDDMETGFLNASGSLADKLMAAMQGAKRIGAQTSCTGNQTSSKSAFLRVAKVADLYTNYGHLTVDLNVSKTDFAEDPIDVLQSTYDFYLNNPGTTCTDTVTSYPYAESFETDLGLWVQNDLDLSHVGNTDFDWIRNQDETPTPNTGPSNATDGDFYLYTEASGANLGFPTKRAVLNSPCFNLSSLTGTPTLTFDYHMFGNNSGNMAVRVNDGSGWKTIWLLNGNQGNQWNTANISLEDYSDQTIQIRMDSTTGLGERSDTAIDNIFIAQALSVEDIALEAINLYPNPVKNSININSPKITIENVTVYDMGGRVIYEVNPLEALNVQIDTFNLEAAMYFVKISTTEGFIIKQVIKQ
jgi:uncharacterized Ntn-hydrolase superfamily protein